MEQKNRFSEFQLPSEIAKKGDEMTRAYRILYIIENFLRIFIEQVARNSYGEKYSDKLKIGSKISKRIMERKTKEKIKKWLSLRGTSDLFYTDLIDLKTIISSNYEIFKEYFPKETWISSKLEDLYDLRVKVAHNSYLDQHEQITLTTITDAIYRQLEVKFKFEVDKQSIAKEKTTNLDQNNQNYQVKAQELLLKVNNREISISVILPEYYDFLRNINEKEEVKWIEAELSGNISEIGKEDPEYFEYRNIKGYISPYEIVPTGTYSLDMIAADKKSLMFKRKYIPSISIHELEKFSEKSTGFGCFTLSKEYMDSIGINVPGISEYYFYFNPSGVTRIITNIRSKIGAYLIQYIRKL